MAGQRIAHNRSRARDEIEDALGQRRLRHQPRKLEGVVGRLAAWLDHDGIARHQRGCHLAHDQEEGKVPRQNAGNHADGHLVEQDVLAGAVTLDDLALVAPGKLRHVIQVVGGEVHLYLREGENLALLLRDHARQGFAVGADQRGDLAQVARTPDGRQCRPALLGFFSRQHGAVHLLDCAGRKLRNHLFSRGVHHLQHLGRRYEFTVDQHLVALEIFFGCAHGRKPLSLHRPGGNHVAGGSGADFIYPGAG